jgi:hypothetical protein
LHAVDILCISYYEAFQRKKRTNSWNDCHSRIECLDSKSVIKNMLGFRACNFQHVSLASGRTVFSYCGADPSKAKKRLSSPTPTNKKRTSRTKPPPPPKRTTQALLLARARGWDLKCAGAHAHGARRTTARSRHFPQQLAAAAATCFLLPTWSSWQSLAIFLARARGSAAPRP